MTTLDSSSATESSMDENGSNGHRKHRRHQALTKANSAATTVTTANNQGRSPAATATAAAGLCFDQDDDGGAMFQEGEGDAEVWVSFTENFRQVQSVLDRNRLLIQQVNENHQSKIHDNLVKNVALIQEINGNISKVVSLYSDFSATFSGMFHQGNGEAREKSDEGQGDAEKA
ncbi:hypothetical protein NMG60_11011955 [Bertholletia excelsa]